MSIDRQNKEHQNYVLMQVTEFDVLMQVTEFDVVRALECVEQISLMNIYKLTHKSWYVITESRIFLD
uniref:Uncharacterized protein n=1 Tax=Arion vulgaris TaxID=1028688 RepID=A0A0B6ZRK0_9EUPU